MLASLGCAAQHGQLAITPTRIEEAKKTLEIDYKVIGAPMPELRLLRFRDTTQKEVPAPEPAPVAEKKGRKGKRPVIKKSDAAGMDRKFLTSKDFDNGANLIIMMFNPTCSHCEDETELLEKNIFLFTKSKLILMANPMMQEYIPNFARSFNVTQYRTITLGVDSGDFITKTFIYGALPQINIYSRDRKLLRTFSGETSIDSLKNYIE